MPRYSPGMGVRGFPLTSALKELLGPHEASFKHFRVQIKAIILLSRGKYLPGNRCHQIVYLDTRCS